MSREVHVADSFAGDLIKVVVCIAIAAVLVSWLIPRPEVATTNAAPCVCSCPAVVVNVAEIAKEVQSD
jgi:hypothetical protein